MKCSHLETARHCRPQTETPHFLNRNGENEPVRRGLWRMCQCVVAAVHARHAVDKGTFHDCMCALGGT